MTDVYNELRELIAAECHSQWAGWTRYQFTKLERGQGSALVVPGALVERWTRQMETPYDQLPESERESDRVEADKIIALLNQKGYISIPKP